MSNIESSIELEGLSPKKRALFELLLREKRRIKSDARTGAIPKRPDREFLPLSFSQQRIWFLDRLEPGNSFYNLPLPVQLRGPLEVKALEMSLNEIIRRHEILRANFKLVDGQPAQFIRAARALELRALDLTSLPLKDRYSRADALAEEEARKPFDLTCDLLIRAKLLRLAQREHRLILTMHHIVSDAWSIGILVQEVAELYRAFSKGQPSPLAELPIQYGDFAHWQVSWLKGEALANQLAYWKRQFAGGVSVLKLPCDRPRPPVQSYKGATRVFFLPTQLHRRLKALARSEDATMFMLLMAAFQVLLFRYCGQEDISVGTPIANRKFAETEGLIGLFANTLVMKTDLSGNPTFREALARVREVALGAYAHQDVPFEKLVEELQPKRDLSHSPLFQVAFVLQNASAPQLSLCELSIEPLMADSGTAKFDLTMTVAEEPEARITGAMEYNTDLFDASTIDRMLGHFQTLLEGATANPEQRISELPLLTQTERFELARLWSGPREQYPQDLCLHHLFEAQARNAPHNTAIEFEGQALSYDQLNERANQLAHYLRSLGAGRDEKVALCLERSPQMIVALLAILKAGAAYVPLDPAYPSERLSYILEDSKAQILLTQSSLTGLSSSERVTAVCIDSDWPSIALRGKENPAGPVSPENLAYAIYTSGSTGRPKGVEITHRAVVNFLNSMRREPGLTSSDVMLSVTTISFDIAALEIFLPLSVGAKLVLVPRAVAADGAELIKRLRASKATVMQATPATWVMMLQCGWEGDRNLKALCGGESLTCELAEKLSKRSRRLWNMFGPTETTIWSTVAEIERAGAPATIGRPIDNTEVRILDRSLHPVPVGVFGEIYISGDGLARGYINMPDLTAARFLPDPFAAAAGQRMYSTGDLGRLLEDGRIEHAGRIDNQVKIRGYRIEPGEVEAILRQHPCVREAAVLAREDKPGETRLVGYVVRDCKASIQVSDLRGFLKERLPSYMVPAGIVALDRLPLTPNGKLDRKALPAPDAAALLEEEFTAPRVPLESDIATIWRDVLATERIGVRENFFDIGGHSLLATRVLARLQEAFGVELPLRDLFEYPTVAELAFAVVKKQAEQVDPLEVAFMLDELERMTEAEALATLLEYNLR